MRHVEKVETQAAQTMERTFAQKIHCLVVRALRSKGFFSILFPILHFLYIIEKAESGRSYTSLHFLKGNDEVWYNKKSNITHKER